MVIDINLDDGLLDGLAAMQKFCKIAVTEPDVSKARVLAMNYVTAPSELIVFRLPSVVGRTCDCPSSSSLKISPKSGEMKRYIV